MKKTKSEFKQLTRDQLKRITGGTQSSELNQCGSQAGGAHCPNGECCSFFGFCGTTADYCLDGCNCQLDCFPC